MMERSRSEVRAEDAAKELKIRDVGERKRTRAIEKS
jgi:hypothetical protein